MKKIPKIEIYLQNNCPYCDMAKNLLASYQLNINDFICINVKTDPNEFENMKQRSNNRKTTPQIFINDKHIGGYDDLKKLHDENKLGSLVL